MATRSLPIRLAALRRARIGIVWAVSGIAWGIVATIPSLHVFPLLLWPVVGARPLSVACFAASDTIRDLFVLVWVIVALRRRIIPVIMGTLSAPALVWLGVIFGLIASVATGLFFGVSFLATHISLTASPLPLQLPVAFFLLRPIYEELLFRFWLQTHLTKLFKKVGIWLAIAIFWGLHAGFSHSIAVGPLLFGIVSAYLYEETGSLGVTIVAHYAFNAAVFIGAAAMFFR